jgi:NAD-dependent SIR2 family protein deacetylase
MANSEIQAFVQSHRRLFVLTGAGCNPNSGIHDYRDTDGNWKRNQPVRFQAFMADETDPPSLLGPQLDRLAAIRSGRAERRASPLAQLEASGGCQILLTQNVDGDLTDGTVGD